MPITQKRLGGPSQLTATTAVYYTVPSARDRAIGIPDMSDDMSRFLREKLDPVMAFGGGNVRNTIQP